MPAVLRILAITPVGENEITQIDGGCAFIGREPENMIVVDSNSVSRRHACIFEAGTQWVFRDLGSTNGSRVNGVSVTEEQIKLLRSGDILSIADFQMRIAQYEKRDTRSLPRPGVSLLIFADERFVSESTLRRGASFVIGGPEGHIYLSGALNDTVQLEILYDGEILELLTGGDGTAVALNGNVFRGETRLVDRDEITIGHYQIVVSYPESDPELEERQAEIEQVAVEEVRNQEPVAAYDRPNVPEHLKPPESDGWESEASRRKTIHKRFVFGTDPEEENVQGTLSMPQSDFNQRVGFEMNPSQRFANATFSEEQATRAISRKFLIVLFVVIVGVLGGIASMVWTALK